MLIIENNKPMVIKIGEWINNHIDNPSNKGEIVYYGQEDANMELLDISKRDVNAYVLSCDNNGNVDWHHITNVTRHDPSQYVYNIKTKWGRSVTVVESKSLLIWNDDKKEFEQKDMSTVNIGDKVPLTFNAPNINKLTHIDVKQYLGKGYVLGEEIHNTKKFDIVPTNIYSKFAKRTSPSIPAQFALNAENGFMVGIYLADGNSCKDYVSIAKNDDYIRSIVREWFDSNGITHRTQIKKENPECPGLSISTRGYSTIHAEFFDKLVGKLAHGKYVPHEAFLAPDEFVKGLIDGYFSGDGCITDYHVQASSVSQQLIYGISHLLSRYGIFCKISLVQEKPRGKIQNILPRYTLSIQSKYVYKFAKTFSLSMKYKQDKLNELVSRDTLDNMSYLYEEHNDIMLDSIVSIEKIDASSNEQYKKVFDITVPDTLNFQIFNGMNCADTSDVGYLQRKLVKAMEDCKVNHDYTVRNASGSIIQFVYGEDGMDPTKIEDQPLPFVKMDYSKLKRTYLLTEDDNLQFILDDDVIENLHDTKDWQKRFETHFQEILEDREFVMKHILASDGGNKIKYPIAFARITNNAKAMFNKYDDGALSDLDPIYALNTINKMCEELYVHQHNKANKFLKMLIRCYLSPKKCIFDYKFNRLAFDYVINQIKQRFYDSIAHPSDMVGVVAAQSLGEPCTQLTLNSVEWNTPMLFLINGSLEKYAIGDFIDRYIAKSNKDSIEKHTNNTTLAWVKDMDIKVMSCDAQGKITWEKVEAVTQHPPINKDGTNTLLKITTKSKREVIATKAKSFLKRVDNQIVQVNGDELVIGDFLPLSRVFKLSKDMIVNVLDVSQYLPKTEWLYMSEVSKAKEYQKKYRHWYQQFNGNEFTLPYSRSDGFLETFVKCKAKQEFHEGCVYPKKTTRTTNCIPENIPLTAEFGFLVGAYLSEGCTTYNHVLISNVDENFLDNIRSICSDWKMGYHMDRRFIKVCLTQTLRIHSTVLAHLFDNMLGNGSSNKRLPSWILQANDDFVKAVLDGYFSGDGSIAKNDGEKSRNVISATSTSRELLESIQQLLLRYDIVSIIDMHDTPKYEAKRNRFNSVQVAYKLTISCSNTQRFADNITLVLDNKQKRLNNTYNTNCLYNYGKYDVVPNIITKQHGEISIHRDRLQQYVEACDNDEDLDVYRQILEEDILYDEIVSIEDFESEHPFVYDLTVENTRNFNIYNGLCLADTFHLSGVASASKAVRGVPRIKELISVSKNIKTPSMSIYLKNDIASDDKKSTEVLNNIQTTLFKDLVKSTKMYYDPDDFETTIEEDKFFVETYRELTSQGLMQKTKLYPWLLRFELDRSALVEHDVSMLDIYTVLAEYYEDLVNVMFSDDNSKNLIFRIKIEDTGEDRDIITEMKALERSILENVIIKGVSKISKVVKNQMNASKYVPSSMTIESEQEWVLETAGTNMLDVLALNEIDPTRTISNDIIEINELLGVEAARQALYNELYSVIADAGLYVNYRHIALLVDTMTNKGYLLSIDRHGINRTDIGPFAKCSFEETTDMLIKAGIFAEVDRINGVSANTMLGQIPPAGTGDTDVLIDEWKLHDMTVEQQDTQQEILQAYDNAEELQEEQEMPNLDFDFALPDNL
jgi:DNA-directed RNA polymerase beta' subunit